MSIILKTLVNAFLLYAVAYIVPGIVINNYVAAIIAFLVLSAINTFIKPVLSILTLPINFLTLGLVGFVINILLFMLIGAIVPGVVISGFLSAALGLILYNVFQTVINLF